MIGLKDKPLTYHSTMNINLIYRYKSLVAMAAVIGVLTAIKLAIGEDLVSREQHTERNLKIAYPIHGGLNSFDPASIKTIAHYSLVENLFSPLVEFGDKGEINPGVAGNFYWDNDELVFEMRNSIRTSAGLPITADDAAISLKRVMIRRENTHGDLTSFLCPGRTIASLSDECSGIRVEDGKLKLKIFDASLRPFLVPLLASADFSIIPASSIDISKPGLPLKGYSNTSGPYYVSSGYKEGAVTLTANKSHYHYDVNMPQEIELIDLYGEDASLAYEDGRADMITVAGSLYPSQIEELAKICESDSFSSFDIRLNALQFSKKGQGQFNSIERRYIGSQVKRVYLSEIAEDEFSETLEFFPPFGEGGLAVDQLEQLKAHFLSDRRFEIELSRPALMYVPPTHYEIYAKAFSQIPHIVSVKLSKVPPWTLPPDEQPDMYLSFTDAGFYESISLLSYYIGQGSFSVDGLDEHQWLLDYMRIEDKSARLSKLRDFHYNVLVGASFVPIARTSYTAIVKAPWRLNFSKFYADNSLWKIRAN